MFSSIHDTALYLIHLLWGKVLQKKLRRSLFYRRLIVENDLSYARRVAIRTGTSSSAD